MSEPILCTKCGHTILTNDIEFLTTPVPDLLSGNYVPSESQVQMMRDTISSARAGISRLDGEITRLNAVLDSFTRRRDALRTHVDLHIALVVPIKRLPPEVLSEIFLHYNDENGIHPFRVNMAPLLLSSVCSRWRTIVLSTPRLWASFTLTIQPIHVKSDVVFVKAWLARAGTCPLTIRLVCHWHGNYQNFFKPLMDVFLLHCEQWCDIDLSLPLPILESLAPAKNRLPRLQRLHLDPKWEGTLDIFEFAPRLHWIELASCPNPLMIKAPWDQIEYLDMERCEVDECLELLRTTPNLEECFIRLFPSEPRQSHSSVQLLRLRSMTINGNPTYLFDTLSLPKLHEISIDTFTPWSATSQFISLLSRCSLAKLSLDLGNDLSDDDMIQVLQACPSLVELNLHHQHMSTSFLAQFTYRRNPENSTTQQLVPMLRTMNINYTETQWNIPDFANAIRSRIISNSEDPASDDIAGLQTVKIYYTLMRANHVVNLATLSPLRQLRETGLEISIFQEGKDIL